MASVNAISEIQKKDYGQPDLLLGKGAMMPFAASNSGSRKLMFGTQVEHRLGLINPDVAYIQTGYEKQFGYYSSSRIETDEKLQVIGSVAKYEWLPKHHYYLFAANHENKTVHVFERKEYKHVTESYGYLFDNSYLDSLSPKDIIPAGTTVMKSNAFDEYENRADGKNLLTMYTSCEHTMEDAIVVSESAAKKLTSPLIKKVSIVINDNDIPLNRYGDASHYKIFPDIGETTNVDSILCAFRREKKEECLFNQSYSRLRELFISDEKYFVAERVVDVDIHCNAPDKLDELAYNEQLKKYYDNNMRMCQDIVNILEPYHNSGYKFEYLLERLYMIAKQTINGAQYFSERVFSNIVLEITLIEEIEVAHGDKLSNRYGGKGITSRVVQDEMMPRTKSGEVFDIMLNMCGVYGRENAGQLFEITVSYICIKLLQYMQLNVLDAGETIDLYFTLLRIVAPSMVEMTEELFANMTDDDCVAYITNIYSSEKSMYLIIEPMSENMTIDKVDELYRTFSWIKPEKVLMPLKDSVGNIRYVPSNRPLVYGYQYIYRLKQYAEEKFSVTSLSATNIRNENSKSKSSNQYKALYSSTPIRFGDMETGNMVHLGAELVVQILMIYSTSPNARRLSSQLLTGDSFNIDVRLDMDSTNRNAEILNVYLKTMGLRLVFKRVPKKKEYPLLIDPMLYTPDPYKIPDYPMYKVYPDEKYDIEEDVRRLINMKNGIVHAFEVYPMEFYTMDHEWYRKAHNIKDPYFEWLEEYNKKNNIK